MRNYPFGICIVVPIQIGANGLTSASDLQVESGEGSRAVRSIKILSTLHTPLSAFEFLVKKFKVACIIFVTLAH